MKTPEWLSPIAYRAEPTSSRVGPKDPVRGERAVCSSQHPLVTDAMAWVLRDGNAIDAAIAGALLQATVQQVMTNHAGTVTMLMWEAETATIHELNSYAMIAPDLPRFGHIPASRMGRPRHAHLPGFMPGLKALYERFATRPWASLCEPAIFWATEGFVVSSLEHRTMSESWPMFSYTEAGRAHFAPDGDLPQVGDRVPNPALAETLRNLAAEGPDYFITGGWAEAFVKRANDLGWPVEKRHMSSVEPRWSSGTRFSHRGYEVVQQSPPQMQAVHCAIVLGILRELDIAALGHYSESAEALYYMAHALRRARLEVGYINDPLIFEDPTATLMSAEYHKFLADVLRTSRPKIDLSRHVQLQSGRRLPREGITDSCEISIVDSCGNWVQMMNTRSLGGIPGEVVGGVPMEGGDTPTSLNSSANRSGWLTGGGHVRSCLGNTLVLREGRPWMALGTPGHVHCTVPQVLSNVLDYGMNPLEAEAMPLMTPLTDDYVVSIESRLAPGVELGLAKMGVSVVPLEAYTWHKGSFEMSWVGDDGALYGGSGRRREGKSLGI